MQKLKRKAVMISAKVNDKHETPQVGSIWRHIHYRSRLVTVISVLESDSTFVMLRSISTPQREWTIDLAKFLNFFEQKVKGD